MDLTESHTREADNRLQWFTVDKRPKKKKRKRGSSEYD